MRLLVTGVSGFIGRNFAAYAAARGHDVVGIDVGPAPGPWPHIEADVRDSAALERVLAEHSITDILHGGGISGPHVANENPALVTAVNVAGTVGLFDAARHASLPGRVVLLSSSSVYGKAWEQRSLTRACVETDVLLASEPYGSSKVASEAMMRAYIDEFDLDAVALRVSIVYGPRRTTYCGITEMIGQATDSGVIVLHEGADLPLPWVHIDDVCTGLDAAFAAPREKVNNSGVHAYNVTGPGAPTFVGIAKAVASVVPGVSIEQGSGPDAYVMNARTMSTDGAATDLGWTPTVSIDDGVADLVAAQRT
ncbi:NAD-dependent epimerase/dehydratase family protein [Rhodococcoides yunnanense]|uniref:NAD-dependent epimerase/dehydratase family protein n=1 Tax=Rhodococcoides yunnanense TaxID=278209 RepID=UPI000933A3F0|nr:NAD(P)-dependent oxidoreductase [Rhodococcus yunnanensis]